MLGVPSRTSMTSSGLFLDSYRGKKLIRYVEFDDFFRLGDHSYLVEWEGWPLSAASWEPEANITDDLLRSYACPAVSENRKQEELTTFFVTLHRRLRGNGAQHHPFEVPVALDVFRCLFGD
ncbi:hypothetical protein GQR58_026427 [Nymphon striatum]|nr:hypothetical protein GQR58_026427 [Nymphon striatum]